MSKIIDQHSKIRSLNRTRLNATKMNVFGVFCAERQWLVYEKAASGKKWDNKKLFREILDKIWDFLLEKGDKPQGYWELCEESIIEKMEDESDGFARDASISFSGLTYIIENDIYEPNSIEGTIESSLDMINAFLSDFVLNLPVSSASDLIIEAHNLVINEIKEQDYCIEMILSPDFSVETIEMLRKRATGQSIFADYWFN